MSSIPFSRCQSRSPIFPELQCIGHTGHSGHHVPGVSVVAVWYDAPPDPHCAHTCDTPSGDVDCILAPGHPEPHTDGTRRRWWEGMRA